MSLTSQWPVGRADTGAKRRRLTQRGRSVSRRGVVGG